MSAALLAYLAARKRHKKARKRRQIDGIIDALKDDEDREVDRLQSLADADQRQAEVSKRERVLREERAKETILQRWIRRLSDIIQATWVQTIQYVIMLVFFQSLTATVRVQEEFYLDSFIGSMLIANSFNAHHHGFRDIRRARHSTIQP